MNAKEFMDRFFVAQTQLADAREFRLYSRILLHKIADVSHDLRLADGQSLNDGLDFSAILRELAEASVLTQAPRPAMQLNRTCPDCRHEHEGKDECGYYLGEMKSCRCTSQVLA